MNQRLRSKVLFFANEAHITATANEDVVLNQQLELELPLDTAQYPISMAEQVAFIGEQMKHYPDNVDRVLWKTAKYAQRILDAIDQIKLQTNGQGLTGEIIAQAEELKPLVKQLLEIKKDTGLITLEAKDAAVARLPNAPRTAADWGNRLFDLYVEVRLQVQPARQ